MPRYRFDYLSPLEDGPREDDVETLRAAASGGVARSATAMWIDADISIAVARALVDSGRLTVTEEPPS